MSNEIVEDWKKTGLLEGIPENDLGKMAVALENQKIFNEVEKDPVWFRRYSIPIIRRVLCCVNFEPYLHRDTKAMETDVYISEASLDSQAEYLSSVCKKIVNWIDEWCAKNNKKLSFQALGLSENGNVLIYGMN